MLRIGILISGRGSNMAAIIDAVNSGSIPNAEIAIVLSDKNDAFGLTVAAEKGIETACIERNSRKRKDHDAEIGDVLENYKIDLICLAGYMRLLSPEFVKRFEGKIVNIHPSLLPAFKGLDAQRQAFDAGVKISGCTVHYVDELLDHGKIVAQKAVDISECRDADAAAKLILAAEHQLYPAALAEIVRIKHGKSL